MKTSTIKLQDKLLCIGDSLFILLNAILQQYRFIWLALLLFINVLYLLSNYKNFKIKINVNTTLGYFFLTLSILGLIIPELITPTIRFGGTIIHVATLFIVFLMYLNLSNAYNWEKYMVRLLAVVGLFFIIGSIWQLIDSRTLLIFNQSLFTLSDYISSYKFINWGYLTGFTMNPGINGFFLSITLLLLYIYFFKVNSKTKKVIILLMVGINGYLLIMTNKRGFLLFTVLIMIYLTLRLAKNKTQSATILLISGALVIALLLFTDGGRTMIDRSLRQLAEGNLSTDRLPVYQKLWADFLERPIFGNGTYTTNSVVPIYNGHNIYLQVLRENGLVGFLVFLVFIIYNLFKSDKYLRNSQNEESRAIIAFSIALQLLFVLWGLTGNPLYDVYPLLTYITSVALYLSHNPISRVTKISTQDN